MSEIVIIRGTRHVVWECRNCGVVSTCPETLENYLREVGGYRSCCNGHQWGWSKEESGQEKLRRERDSLAQQIAQRDDEIKHQRELREAAERQAAAARGQVTKLKKRASAGVCPCCNRTFSELHKHMTTKHPAFCAEEIAHENVVSIIKARA